MYRGLPHTSGMLNNLSDLDLRLIRIFLAVVDAGGLMASVSDFTAEARHMDR